MLACVAELDSNLIWSCQFLRGFDVFSVDSTGSFHTVSFARTRAHTPTGARAHADTLRHTQAHSDTHRLGFMASCL